MVGESYYAMAIGLRDGIIVTFDKYHAFTKLLELLVFNNSPKASIASPIVIFFLHSGFGCPPAS